MGHQIVVQPNGLLAVWSTVVDDFVVVDATDEELISYYVDEAKQRAAHDSRDRIKRVRLGYREGYQFFLTYEDMLAVVRAREEVYGLGQDAGDHR